MNDIIEQMEAEKEDIIEPVETEKEDITEQMETEKDSGSVIYIGPDIPGVKQYSVYNHGLPDALKEKTKEHPIFLSLIIPIEKMPQANKELLRKGSALTVLLEKANQLKKEM